MAEAETTNQPTIEAEFTTKEEEVTKKKKVKASRNKAKDVETKPELPPNPVARKDIEKKIKRHEEDLGKLLAKAQELQNQLIQVTKLADAKKGAIAGLRDLIGSA